MILRGAALALAATVLVVPSAQAAPPIVDQTDAAGDVQIFDGGGSRPTFAQRSSIDLRRFTAQWVDEQVVLTFHLARITGSRAYDQVVEVELVVKGKDVMSVVANPQHKTATAFGGGLVCTAPVKTSRRTNTVRVLVGEACVPQDTGTLRVTTYTQKPNGSGPDFSEDTMRVDEPVSF